MDKNLNHSLKIKRIYEKRSPSDGFRILVDRLWPRGIKKVEAHVDLWLKNIAPSKELRTWFAHDPEKFDEFTKKYKHELQHNKDLIKIIVDKLKESPVTLLYSAHDTSCNQAVVLQDFILSNI